MVVTINELSLVHEIKLHNIILPADCLTLELKPDKLSATLLLFIFETYG